MPHSLPLPPPGSDALPVATGQSHAEILKAYLYLEVEDIRQGLAYAAWRAEEFDVAVTRG